MRVLTWVPKLTRLWMIQLHIWCENCSLSTIATLHAATSRTWISWLHIIPPLDLETLSVSKAAEKGVAAIVRQANEGRDLIVERHGVAIAAIVSMDRFNQLSELERDLRSAALVLSRFASDDGSRTDLDRVITSFGFTRSDLEAELESDQIAGRD